MSNIITIAGNLVADPIPAQNAKGETFGYNATVAVNNGPKGTDGKPTACFWRVFSPSKRLENFKKGQGVVVFGSLEAPRNGKNWTDKAGKQHAPETRIFATTIDRGGNGSLSAGTIVGNISNEPVVRATKDGRNIVTFSVATDTGYMDKKANKWVENPLFVSVISGAVEFIQKYFHKGSSIVMSGVVNTNVYDDKNGVARVGVQMYAQNMTFGYHKADSAQNGNAPAAQNAAPAAAPAPAQSYRNPAAFNAPTGGDAYGIDADDFGVEDEDLPF